MGKDEIVDVDKGQVRQETQALARDLNFILRVVESHGTVFSRRVMRGG